MKIFSDQQIRNCDKATIRNEQISSLQLMEKAAKSCVDWIVKNYKNCEKFYLFCGNGNNGGDGFVIARMLYHKGFDVTVFVDLLNNKRSEDAQNNFEIVKQISGISIVDFDKANSIEFDEKAIIIDAIYGTGLNKPLQGKPKELIEFLNNQKPVKIAIDIPSGLSADFNLVESSIAFQANETLSFQFWKKSFLHPETGKFCGNVHILDIQLDKNFIESVDTENFVIDFELIKSIYRPRPDFSNKGNFGKTTLIAGSFGKIGAAVLATKAALKSGSGLTFSLAPNCGYDILQISCPEAMFISGGENHIQKIEIGNDFVIGIGSGLGTNSETIEAFLYFFKTYKQPLVIDADALNILSLNKDYINLIPANSIITPHPKEFERLFGATKNSYERLELARKKAEELNIYIILKDHHTQIVSPNQKVFYNITGNSGMAKGGSGDALTGIVTSLLAQNYSSLHAAIFGVWLHGKAGDFAAEKFSKEAMQPSDLIDEIGNVFKLFNQ